MNMNQFTQKSLEAVQSAQTIAQVKAAGVTPVLLTGDHQEAAQAIARQLGIGQVKWSCLPQDKLDIIDTYVYRLGIESSKYSYSSAVGLLKNVINLMLVLLTNWFAKRIGQSGLF